ncbi:unnamed protein product [Chironomus riparius]|uniref:Dynamin GTPase n=1 Tax=Chironomus riparius TaxID=315576 RepID=A0A9N9RZZ9_9DIPT|nr:unnamed protein product [Chironomus riparius]
MQSNKFAVNNINQEMPKATNKSKMMDNMIGSINKIQNILNNAGIANSIELPQIVMLGTQSAGKSSVLESIVHRPFLPRGSGVVTRCPLVLQLVECKMTNKQYRKQSNGTTEIEEWGEFSHLEGQIFSNFDLIRKEIEDQTDKLAGNNKGICKQPISLKIYSPHVVNLTLVDLPGITKVPVGDQPQNIEYQITELVMEYIKNEKSIILSVSAANNDIATSESLKYSKQVDKNGDRTLAILTKVDAMVEGTDAREMLSGKLIPVKLGIIGVINRSQKDIEQNKTIDEQINDEKAFFEQHYKDMAKKQGIPFLANRLSELLISHIHKFLPEVKKEIATKLRLSKEALDECGEEIEDRDDVISLIITETAVAFSTILEGKEWSKIKDVEPLVGGPKLRRIFDDTFGTALAGIELDFNKQDIMKNISNSGSFRPAVFVSNNHFEDLVYKQIEHLREPSIKCVDQINKEMENVIHKLITEQQKLTRFPVMQKKIRTILKNFLNKRVPIAKEMVNELINTELSSINTNHPNFSIEDALKETSSNNYQQPPYKIRKTEKDAKTIQNLVENYFPIVRTTIQDQVPKIICHKIIKFMMKNIQSELLKQLRNETDADLLEESEENALKREKYKKDVKAYQEAEKEIEDFELGY